MPLSPRVPSVAGHTAETCMCPRRWMGNMGLERINRTRLRDLWTATDSAPSLNIDFGLEYGWDDQMRYQNSVGADFSPRDYVGMHVQTHYYGGHGPELTAQVTAQLVLRYSPQRVNLVFYGDYHLCSPMMLPMKEYPSITPKLSWVAPHVVLESATEQLSPALAIQSSAEAASHARMKQVTPLITRNLDARRAEVDGSDERTAESLRTEFLRGQRRFPVPDLVFVLPPDTDLYGTVVADTVQAVKDMAAERRYGVYYFQLPGGESTAAQFASAIVERPRSPQRGSTADELFVDSPTGSLRVYGPGFPNPRKVFTYFDDEATAELWPILFRTVRHVPGFWTPEPWRGPLC